MQAHPPQVVRWLIPLLLLGASALLGLRVRKEKAAADVPGASALGVGGAAAADGKGDPLQAGKACCERPPSRSALFKEAAPSTEPPPASNDSTPAATKP